MRDNHLGWEVGYISKDMRIRVVGQKGLVIWLTGLSGSGKSTIAVEVERKLIQEGYLVYRLDGDNLRHGLNKDLGFSYEDRCENIRRIAEVSSLFADAGFIILVAAISPYKEVRDLAKTIIGEERYFEVYVQADLELCKARDSKGLYKKADSGVIENFTGISDVYEVPVKPHLIIDTGMFDIEKSSKMIVELILENCLIK